MAADGSVLMSHRSLGDACLAGPCRDGKEPSPVPGSRRWTSTAGGWRMRSVWPSWVSPLVVRLVRPGSVRMIGYQGPDGDILTRAFTFEAAPVAGFADTVGNFHGAGIDALAAAGITDGCATDPLRYCPGEAVTRAQMATFQARALGLVPLPEMVAPAASRLAYTQESASVSSVIVVDSNGSDRTLDPRPGRVGSAPVARRYAHPIYSCLLDRSWDLAE